MRHEADLFVMYRWMLVIVCTVYTLICTGQTLLRWLAYFGESRRKQVLGHYAAVLLLRTRLRRFSRDLLEIGVLLVLLAAMVYSHRGIEASM